VIAEAVIRIALALFENSFGSAAIAGRCDGEEKLLTHLQYVNKK